MSKGQKSPYDAAVDKLRALSRKRPHRNDLWTTVRTARTSITDDHSFILIVGAALEQALEIALATHFVLDEVSITRLFDDDSSGPLSNFAAKIKIAFALGIFDKPIKEELDLIRHIRNSFAHSKETLTFLSPEIVNACGQLIVPQRWFLLDRQHSDANPSREQFLVSCHHLFLYLESPNHDGTPKNFKTDRLYNSFFCVPPPLQGK
jgi:hypothetical protein